MTSLYNGWTPEPKYRAEAKAALWQCRQAMGVDNYTRWYFEQVNPLQSWLDVLMIAEAWLHGDDCDCNGGLTCTKCKPLTDEIPY